MYIFYMLFGKKNSRSARGFTLIELLVVIAIIGILSAVVLAALSTARNKGADASTKGNLDSIRTESAVYIDTNSNYGTNASADAGSCSAAGTLFVLDTVVARALTAVTNTGLTPVCNQAISGGAWLVYVPAKTAGTNGWCTDSSGTSKSEPSVVAGGATYICP